MDPEICTFIKIKNETQLKRQAQNEANAENRDLKNMGKDAKTQAKSGYSQTGQKSEKHRLAENR